jgi:hypothetical protein
MSMKRFRMASVLIAIVMAAGSTSAAALPGPGIEPNLSPENAQKMQELRGGDGQNCVSSSTVKIQVDGREGEFTLDDKGNLVSGSGEPKFSGCSSENSREANTSGATAAASTFSYAFGPGRTTYAASDANSNFWAQQSYASGLTTAYRWEPSAGVRAIIYGDALQAYAFKSPDNCSYNKPGYDADYIYHWSCTGQSNLNAYYMWGQWSFRASGPGWSGTADINWDFSYQITYV